MVEIIGLKRPPNGGGNVIVQHLTELLEMARAGRIVSLVTVVDVQTNTLRQNGAATILGNMPSTEALVGLDMVKLRVMDMMSRPPVPEPPPANAG